MNAIEVPRLECPQCSSSWYEAPDRLGRSLECQDCHEVWAVESFCVMDNVTGEKYSRWFGDYASAAALCASLNVPAAGGRYGIGYDNRG